MTIFYLYVLVSFLELIPATDGRLISNDFSINPVLNDEILTESAFHSAYAKSKLDCVSKCGKDERCLMASYNAGERWCRLYEDGTGVSTEATGWRSWRVSHCLVPPVLQNGEVSNHSTRIGSVLSYTCLRGYMFVGTSLESLCTEDGTWSGLDASCELVTDCRDIQDINPTAASGVYSILPTVGSGPISVYCDMTDDGGGWTVFQRRTDGSENFYRDWSDYKNGFGNLYNEFWLGNTNIWRLTNQRRYELWIDLEDWTGARRYASYSGFQLNDEADGFRLVVEGFTGNTGDSLNYQNNQRFTTYDNDNSGGWQGENCAVAFTGAWWYNACHYSNLNGLYNNIEFGKGINWEAFRGLDYSMKYTAMKIRPNP